MPCYHPISAWQLLNVKTVNGKPTISFKNPYAAPSPTRVGIQVPCGQCIGCRLERSRQWAIRCVHEAYGHADNCFITLTYDNDHLPKDGSLQVKHFQDFMKRLRQHYERGFEYENNNGEKVFFPGGNKIRFFQCGEYGENTRRPHYHACLFGVDIPDKLLYTVRDGCRLHTSEFLKGVWGNGFVTVGDVTFESAAYVARYITKKITGSDEKVASHYQGRHPEYTTMSRRPGIASGWYKNFKGDVFPADEIVLRGKIMRPPRFYDKQLESGDPLLYNQIKLDRKAQALQNAADNTARRLAVKETIKKQQFQMLKRGLENET